MTSRVQLTTDGLASYLIAVDDAFGENIDYALIIKKYGNQKESDQARHRYSPGECSGTEKKVVTGDPRPSLISTSYVERQNLTMRMGMRRFTRLTNAFSKKLDNHCAAVSLHFMHYNFARPHQTLTKRYGTPTTPAMAAGIADHVWTVREMCELLQTPTSN